MLASDMFKVAAFIGKVPGDGMYMFSFALQISRGRVNGEPINGEIGFECAQFARNGEVALDMSQANGAGEKEYLARTAHCASPHASFLRRTDEVRDSTVEQCGIAHRWHMSPTLDGEQLGVRDELVNGKSLIIGYSPVIGAMNHQRWCGDASRMLSQVVPKPSLTPPIDDLARRRPAIAHTILIRFGRVRLGKYDRKELFKV